MLVAFAQRLRSILRPSDTVSRFGSDEFAVLCPDLAHERDAVRLAERMTAGLATPFAVAGQEIVVSASIGIALTGSRTRRATRCCRTPTPPCSGPSTAAVASTSCSTRRSGPS